MIKRIISGGQTGADKGGLLAGRQLGIKTGGTAAPGWRTELGPDYSLKDYGLVEGEADPQMYPKRTLKNVVDSDATLVIGNISSSGSKLTIKFCESSKKHYICNPTPEELKEFLGSHRIEVLNVAGNRESVNPGVQKQTFTLLYAVLGKV